MSRPDYCPIGNQPCQSLCTDKCGSRPAPVQVPEGSTVTIPLDAVRWLCGMGDDGFVWPNMDSERYGFRSEFLRRAGIDIYSLAAPSAPVAHEAGAQGSSCEHESEMQYEIQLPDGTYTHLTVYGSERDLKRLGSRLDFFHSREAQLRALLSATAPSAPATVATEAAASVKDSLTAEAVAQGGGLDDGRLWSFLCDVLDSGRCLGDFYRFKEGYHIARDAKACALVNDLRALLSAPLAASGWQPIETAPKDGTRILLAKIGATNAVPGLGIKAREPHVWWACTGHWSEKWKNWNDGIEPCGLAGPNYWHPLPPPPAIANQEAQDGR